VRGPLDSLLSCSGRRDDQARRSRRGYELPGGFIGDLAFKLFAERAVERDLRHSNENFKAIVEAEVPVHA
jgi:hypothetical protein